jgi:hypothetical protein
MVSRKKVISRFILHKIDHMRQNKLSLNRQGSIAIILIESNPQLIIIIIDIIGVLDIRAYLILLVFLGMADNYLRVIKVVHEAEAFFHIDCLAVEVLPFLRAICAENTAFHIDHADCLVVVLGVFPKLEGI